MHRLSYTKLMQKEGEEQFPFQIETSVAVPNMQRHLASIICEILCIAFPPPFLLTIQGHRDGGTEAAG